MNKRFIHIMLLALLLPMGVWAQSALQQGRSQFQRFLTMVEGGNPGNAYSVLWQSYQNMQTAAKTVRAGSVDYNALRTTLHDMHPWIEKAYLYNSQQHQRTNAALFAQAYLDIELMPAMAGMAFEHTATYPLMAYNAAANTYNAREYQRVIPYFKAYLATGEQKRRRDVLAFMMDACMKTKDYASAKEILDEVVANNGSNVNLLKQAINISMDSKDYAAMQRYLTKALTYQPNDPDLMKLQGQLYEETQQFEQALEIFNRLRASNPRSLDLAKHIGLCNYNLGVVYYRAAETGNNVKRNQKLSKDYFTAASRVLADVTAAETGSLKYAQALATSYLFSEQTDKLPEANRRVASLGGVTVSSDATPGVLSYSGNTAGNAVAANTGYTGNTGNTGYPAATTTQIPSSQEGQSVSPSDELPLYSVFAKQYVEERLKKWQAKDPYETADEYRARVNEDTRNAKLKELLKVAEQEYIKTFTSGIRFGRDMKLRPYDAENRVFLIESKYGELLVPVPRENNEARSFENNWEGMQFSNPQYYISGDKLKLSSLTFTTPAGKTYQYSGDKTLNYTETEVDVQFDQLDNSLFASASQKGKDDSSARQKKKVTIGKSDVDTNIPVAKAKNEKTFAVIICNENYGTVSPVPMAQNDGTTFAEYCEKTLGLPKDNVRLYKDASFGVMIRAMRDIESIAQAYQGDLNVIFYYAGHGIPNEQTKDAYLLPTDADGRGTDGCYSLNKLYAQLGALNARSVVVFLDACFSGATRDDQDGMLMSARGVAIKAKREDPRGNMVIFSAASDDETAMPYKEKGHGLFTYYLLKKLQETKGDVTLSELGNYIKTKVKQKSTVVNRKSQTPSVVPSDGLAATWADMKMIR